MIDLQNSVFSMFMMAIDLISILFMIVYKNKLKYTYIIGLKIYVFIFGMYLFIN